MITGVQAPSRKDEAPWILYFPIAWKGQKKDLVRIRAPDRAYSRTDLPRGSAFSRLQGDPRKRTEYHKDHGHDTDDCRHLKIEIEKLIQRGQLKDYVHKETQSVNRRFDRDRSGSPDGPPNITGRVNIISGGKSRGGDSGNARRTYAKPDIYVVTTGARPEFLDMFFSMKDFKGIECPHEDPLVITQVIANFELGRMLVDTSSSLDILFLDAYLKLWMSRTQIRPVATPLVGFTGDAVSPLGVSNLMVTIGKHP
ncbi:hypothetical protein LIER_27028 [Lithospermum erythrorhizon]|uniref:Uncharacterized protein n=1 Tax=Lithospermum erythrorhizon TaxID=34254 RepID=A0AAV3RAK5_LITER